MSGYLRSTYDTNQYLFANLTANSLLHELGNGVKWLTTDIKFVENHLWGGIVLYFAKSQQIQCPGDQVQSLRDSEKMSRL